MTRFVLFPSCLLSSSVHWSTWIKNMQQLITIVTSLDGWKTLGRIYAEAAGGNPFCCNLSMATASSCRALNGICTRQKPVKLMSRRLAAKSISSISLCSSSPLQKLPMLRNCVASPTSCLQKFGSNICCCGWWKSRRKLWWTGCRSSGSVQSTTSAGSAGAERDTVSTASTTISGAAIPERTTRTWVSTAVPSGRSFTSKQKVQPPGQSRIHDNNLADAKRKTKRSNFTTACDRKVGNLS